MADGAKAGIRGGVPEIPAIGHGATRGIRGRGLEGDGATGGGGDVGGGGGDAYHRGLGRASPGQVLDGIQEKGPVAVEGVAVVEAFPRCGGGAIVRRGTIPHGHHAAIAQGAGRYEVVTGGIAGDLRGQNALGRWIVGGVDADVREGMEILHGKCAVRPADDRVGRRVDGADVRRAGGVGAGVSRAVANNPGEAEGVVGHTIIAHQVVENGEGVCGTRYRTGNTRGPLVVAH